MVDPDRVRRLLGALAEYRDRLARLRGLPPERYLAGDEPFAGRYLVQTAAQTCVDIANHVIASSGWRVPRDFRDAFTVLEENGVIEADLAARLRELASLRNRLVHLYGEVDDSLVYEALGEGIEDLDGFASAVAQVIEREGSEEAERGSPGAPDQVGGGEGGL